MTKLPFPSLTSSHYLTTLINSFFTNKTPSLLSLPKSHALILTSGNSNNLFISSKLISLYASINNPLWSTKVFDSVSEKDTFLWNSIIKAHFCNGNYNEAFRFYSKMRVFCNTPLNEFTVPMVVGACGELLWVEIGRYIHGLVSKCGLFNVDSAIGSCFVYMYAKCGVIGDASMVFDEMAVRDVVSWTALVIGYVQNGESEKGLECVCEMHRVGGNDERVCFRTVEGGIQGCGNLGALVEGRCLHGLVVKAGLGCSQNVQSSLLSMYCKLGDVKDAYNSAFEVVVKDLFSWTSIISVYARSGLMRDCLCLFWNMQADGLVPDGIVLSCMLLGFGNSMNLREGKAFHGLIVRRNYVLDFMVNNALLSMYCKLGALVCSRKLFENMDERGSESWNTMVFGHGQVVGMEGKCIEMFRELQSLGFEAKSNSLVSVISSCSQLKATHLCRTLHGHILKCYGERELSVTNSLLDMYGHCGDLLVARRIFCRTQKDVVTWNSMMSSYTRNRHYEEAVALFAEMVEEKMKPNSATFVTVLSACAHLASLNKGEMVHRYIEEEGFEVNVSVVTALIDMYAKCGQLEISRQLFESLKDRDAVSWNVMISGYGMHGDAKSAIKIFQEMEQTNIRPNTLTFLSLLSACSHAGLVEEGRLLFSKMPQYSVKLNLKHYACMVDLLGRSGNLKEAESLILSMPFPPDGHMWGTLLSACKYHNDIETGIRIARYAIETDPENDGYYVMISDMYNSVGKRAEAERAREVMKKRGVEKKPGWSAF